ncbi:unnamed protein product, partial [Prorocentrum cordatum]
AGAPPVPGREGRRGLAGTLVGRRPHHAARARPPAAHDPQVRSHGRPNRGRPRWEAVGTAAAVRAGLPGGGRHRSRREGWPGAVEAWRESRWIVTATSCVRRALARLLPPPAGEGASPDQGWCRRAPSARGTPSGADPPMLISRRLAAHLRARRSWAQPASSSSSPSSPLTPPTSSSSSP